MSTAERVQFAIGPYQYEYRLFDHIEEVEPGGYIVRVMYFGMNPDGSLKDLPETDVEKLGYSMLEIFSLRDIGVDVMENSPKKCEEWNRSEIAEVTTDLESVRKRAEGLPLSEDLRLTVRFLENVLGRHVLWFRNNGYEMPIVGVQPQAAAVTLPNKLRGPKDVGRFYVDAIEGTLATRPTLAQLSEASKISPTTWHNDLGKPQNILAIRAAVEKKLNMAKTGEKREFWGHVLASTEDLMRGLADRMVKARERGVGRRIEEYGADDEHLEGNS